ncbi:TonB family protein [Archangium gephyra]|uniref:TonB family protein n=1 Tax=Archangium gephyra TaxID=48 RepID=A0ABX9JP01_9BACT|nr:TonB-dependent siderophore myxochelin receptor MxcH [Archangium gephyra]REG23333.1 TonB family protein [Archangium gephyra]
MAPAPVVVPPKLMDFVEADYPAQARSEGLEARVRLRLRIDAQGHVTEAEVMEPVGHGFDEAARGAALRFRFEPARRDGEVKPSRLVYVYEFRLPRESPPPPEDSAAGKELTSGAGELGPIEISVQGESEAERRRQSAESVRVVETERLQRETADLGEALARTEGVGVRRAGGLGSRARFSLAGLTDEQIRFFIDGIPLELAGFGPVLANVPVNLVERVELYQGVVPIRLGTDALGGAVQLVTDRSVYGTGAAASYELGSFDTHRLTAGVRHLQGPTGLLVRANGFLDDTHNDYRINVRATDAQGRLVPTLVPRFHDAYRTRGAGVEVGFVDRPWARRLLLRVFGSGYEKELQHNPTMTVPYGEVDHGELSGGATLRFEQTFFERLSADTVAGYSWRQTRFTDVGECAYDWFGRCVEKLPQPGELESRAVERYVEQHTGFARLNLGWNLSALHTLRLAVAPTVVVRSGEDLRMRARQELDPLSGERNLFSLAGGLEYELDALDGRLENIAFLKDYLQFSRAEKLLPGGTFTRLDQDINGVGLGNSTRFRFSRELYAKASYEWATRLPRPDELFGDGVLVNENLSLKPELSHNFNLGLELESWRTRAGDFRGNVTGFGRLAEQLFQLIGQENYFTWQNVYAARSLGVAAAAGWTSPGQYLVLDGNVTWQDFRNTSNEGLFGAYEGQRLPNRPYLQAHGSARFQLMDLMCPGDELSLTWHTRYVHTFFRSWEGLGQVDSKRVIPSQLLHSLGLTYVFRNAPTTLSWTIDVQNLTDALAFDFYGVQRPGRSLFAKLTVDLGG